MKEPSEPNLESLETVQSSELDMAIESWKQKHRLSSDDPALWLLELFQIHRSRWETLIQPDVRLDSEDRDLLTHVTGRLQALEPAVTALTAEVRHLKGGTVWMPPARLSIVLAIGFALGAGILIGHFLL